MSNALGAGTPGNGSASVGAALRGRPAWGRARTPARQGAHTGAPLHGESNQPALGNGSAESVRHIPCLARNREARLASRALSSWPTRLVIAAAAILLLTLWPPTARADEPPYEPGAVLVRWGPPDAVRAQEATLAALEARAVDDIPQLGITKLRVPPGSEESTAAALRRAGAELVGLNYVRRVALVPNDSYYNQQWALAKVNAQAAWDVSYGSPNIVVAVVDTGIDTTHPDRPQNLVLGADYVASPTGNILVSGDPHGHGTHVAGIVAARMNNGSGVAGLAPGAKLMAVRVLDASGSGDTSTTAKGITYAVDNGAKIINLSLSGLGSSFAEEQAINYAYSKGVMVVAAAGNCYLGGADCEYQTNPVMYPAALQHVVAVAATDLSDGRAWYSETGSYVDLGAPGGTSSSNPSSGILSTCPSSGYCVKSGTSMASPYVAGVAALVWSVNPSLSPDQVEGILRASAVDLGTPGRDDTFGYGRVDAYQAARQAQGTPGYSAQYISQSFPETITAGQQISAWVQIKNTGGSSWQKGRVYLGTSQPRDRASSFYTPGNWPSSSRAATLDQDTVAPGQTGRFSFVLTASVGGTFREDFQLVVDGQTWLDDPMVWFQVQVLLASLPNKIYLPIAVRSASGW